MTATSSSTDQTPPASPAAPGRLRGRRIGLQTGRVLAIGLVLLLAAAVYLSVFGLPLWLTEKILQPLRQSGLVLELRRFRLDLPRGGLLAEKVRFYGQEDKWVPMLEADLVVFKLDPRAWLHGRAGLTGIQLVDGLLRLGAEGEPRTPQDTQNISLQRVSGLLTLEPGGLRIAGLAGDFLGIHIEGQGFIVLPALEADRGHLPRRPFPRTAARIFEKSPAWFPRLVEELNSIRFDTPPQARIDFTIFPDEPVRTEASLNLTGGRSRGRGIVFDQWEASLDWKSQRLSLHSLKAGQGDKKFELTAEYDQPSRGLEAHLFSSLPPTAWTSLIPVEWRDRLENAQVIFSGPMTCELQMGPAPAEEAAAHVSGWLSLERAEVRQVWLERAHLAFDRQGDMVHCRDVDAVLGRDQQQGPVRGELTVNLKTGEYSGQGEAGFDPAVLLSNLNLKQQNIVRSMSFPEAPPRARLEFSGLLGSPEAFRWSGNLAATNCFYNGAFVSSFTTPAWVSNQVMVMDPFLLLREEGRAAGRLELDFSNKTAFVNGTNTADPKVLARLLGTNPEQFMRLYRVEGPVTVVGRGTIDFGATNGTDLQVSVNAEKLGLRWFVADRCAFDLNVHSNNLVITNMVGSLYGGDFYAWINFSGLGTTTNVDYTGAFAWSNVDFSEVVIHLRQEERDPYTGRFSGAAVLSGLVGEGRGNTAAGHGQLSIRGGKLLQIPLLGGLSAMLSRIYPGLGFANQTDLSASFNVRDLRVKTEDLKLEGGVISLQAQGKYFFNEDVDFNVKVVPLREGAIAEVLQFLTSPLTKLLEFHLYGTVREPRWRPENLPKELFFIKD